MRRMITAICLAVMGWSSTSLVAHPALASSLCVGSGAGCYSTIQDALNAAQNGDVIHIGPGTFAGGIAIDKSVSLVGAAAKVTIINGGGSVLTIGTFGASSEPTVSLAGLTITGGLTTSSPESQAFVGSDNVVALGGGIEIPPNASFSGGATVAIANSVITGNRADPTASVPVPGVCPICQFALAAGGGIDNWGTLTLTNTIVSNNQVGSASGVASDADGGGVATQFGGTLTATNSRVVDNRATVDAPDGRFAEGGGIFADNGVLLTVSNSVVDNNNATLSSTYPSSVALSSGMSANGGGIHHSNTGLVTIDNSQISGNGVAVTDLNGEPAAYDAALNPGISTSVVIRNSTISDNRVIATVGSSADVGPSGQALELDEPATISNTQITGNSVTVTSPAGLAWAVGAIFAFDTSSQPAVISNSVIRGNSMRASSSGGTVTVQGGAIFNNGLLELRNDQISENTGAATGPAGGGAQGGGIWNGSLFAPPPVQLTLENTTVTHNTLTASPGLTVRGGGLFTLGFPVTLRNSVIAHNVPDQCFGC